MSSRSSRRIVVALVALSSFVTVLPAGAQTADSGALRLRPGDGVRLRIRDESDLSGDFQLDDAGDVMLPLVGIVPVAARDFGEVRREVSDRYARELSRGEVQLTPLLRIAVLGEVRSPNLYPVDPTFTLADVLALAGGLTFTGDAGRVALVRDGRAFPLSLEPGAPSLAGQLRSGDQLVVERRSWYREHAPTVLTTAASIAIAVFTAMIYR
jgi:polysaccharide export outer membrane protein